MQIKEKSWLIILCNTTQIRVRKLVHQKCFIHVDTKMYSWTCNKWENLGYVRKPEFFHGESQVNISLARIKSIRKNNRMRRDTHVIHALYTSTPHETLFPMNAQMREYSKRYVDSTLSERQWRHFLTIDAGTGALWRRDAGVIQTTVMRSYISVDTVRSSKDI